MALEAVDSDIDVYRHIAWARLDALSAANEAGLPAVSIVPVGPVGQYRRFAGLCNRYGVSCRNLHRINMDAYLTAEGGWVPVGHSLRFRGFMHRELLARLSPELAQGNLGPRRSGTG